MERGDFQGGQLAKATVQLLADYLDMTSDEAQFMRDEHASVVQALPDYPLGAFSGRGITILAGGKYSEIAATTLGMTRLLGSRLPVEIWMIDRVEAQEGWCDEMAAQGGMVCRFVSDYIQDMSAFSHHYQLKIAVIMFSSFAEVLYLDADSMPVVNPDPIFESPAYVDTGAILWPDYWQATESPYTPYITGQNGTKATLVPDIQTVDSGQMLWNKAKHWKSLCLSAYYNYFGPKYWYTLLTQGGPGWGDKDTFPTALRALKAKWTMIPHRLETQRYDDGTGRGMGSGMAMMQADPADDTKFRPLFLHSNFIKCSVRRLMCDLCIEDPSALSAEQRTKGQEVTFKGSVSNRNSNIWKQLNFGIRLFATKDKDGLNNMGRLDTEIDMWRVMERVGCTGVFSEDGICRRTRGFLDKTFGLVASWEGGAERKCS
ncbi:mannosyltransferase [Xanthoria parietina]